MIPNNILEKITKDPWYSQCCITGHKPVQLHHAFIFAYKSIQELWAIVPVSKEIHDQCTQHKPEYSKEMDERVKRIALNRASNTDLNKYSKVVDLIALKRELNDKYDKAR